MSWFLITFTIAYMHKCTTDLSHIFAAAIVFCVKKPVLQWYALTLSKIRHQTVTNGTTCFLVCGDKALLLHLDLKTGSRVKV